MDVVVLLAGVLGLLLSLLVWLNPGRRRRDRPLGSDGGAPPVTGERRVHQAQPPAAGERRVHQAQPPAAGERRVYQNEPPL